MTTPDVRVRLSAEGIQEIIDAFSKVQNEQKKTKDTTKDLTSSFGGLQGVLSGLGIAAIVKKFSDLSLKLIDAADNVGDLSAATGASAEKLSVWTVAAKEANVQVDAMQKGFV